MKERILVVDDQGDNADSLVRLLTLLGHEAKAVYDGHQAVEEAASFQPDIMFIDIGMPGFDGYETVTQIRARKECAHAILIALTGWAQQDDRHRSYERGFDLHIAKPMSNDTLGKLLALLDSTAKEATTTKINRFDSVTEQRQPADRTLLGQGNNRLYSS